MINSLATVTHESNDKCQVYWYQGWCHLFAPTDAYSDEWDEDIDEQAQVFRRNDGIDVLSRVGWNLFEHAGDVPTDIPCVPCLVHGKTISEKMKTRWKYLR